jgi:hypothetical protein
MRIRALETQAFVDANHRVADRLGVLAAQHHEILGTKAAQIVEHAAHLRGVLLGIPEVDLAPLAVVVADQDGNAPCRLGMRVPQGREQEGREQDQRAPGRDGLVFHAPHALPHGRLISYLS